MIDRDGEGIYEVVRRVCDSGNEDRETGQRAHPPRGQAAVVGGRQVDGR